MRVDRLATARELAQARLVEVAVLAQRERPRDRRRGHVQHVRRVPGRALAAERGALAHAEAVLLVDDGDRERIEADRVLDQGMGADDERAGAVREVRERLRAPRRRRRAGQQRERDRLGAEQPLDRREVLLGERLGRGHQGPLKALLDGPQQRVHRHDGLARPDLAHQQPLRWRAPASSAASDLDRGELVGGQLERKPALEPAPRQLALAWQRDRGGAGVLAGAARVQRELLVEELFEGEPLAPALGQRGGAEVHRLERLAAAREARARPQAAGQRVADLAQRRSLRRSPSARICVLESPSLAA